MWFTLRVSTPAVLKRWLRVPPLALVVVVFVVSRALMGWLTDHPDVYENRVDVTSDVGLYEGWADGLAEDRSPYNELRIEYPPGALAVFVAPAAVLPDHSYRTAFVTMMVLVDAAGLLALVLMARRTSHWWGVWFWLLVVPLTGPILYSRFDLVPAVATIWAVERASASRWGGSGSWLGLGALVKLYPLLLLPMAWLIAPRRRRVIVGAAVVGLLVLLPLFGVLDDVYRSVIERNAERGLHVESLFGTMVFIAAQFGYDAEVVFQTGAFDILSGASENLKILSTLLVVAAVGEGVGRSWKRVPRGSAAGFGVVGFATVAVAVGVGPTYSPQFVVWVLAPAAAALGLAPRVMRTPAVLLVGVAVLNHLVFPFWFFDVFAGRGFALIALLGRSLLTAVAGLVAFRAMTRVDRDGEWVEPAHPAEPVESAEPPDDPDPLLELARSSSAALGSSGSEDRREPDPRWFR